VPSHITAVVRAIGETGKFIVLGRADGAAFLGVRRTLTLLAVAIVLSALHEYLQVGDEPRFHLDGVNSILAMWAGVAVLAALAEAGGSRTAAPLAAVAGLSIWHSAIMLIALTVQWVAPDVAKSIKHVSIWVPHVLTWVVVAVMLRALWRAIRQLMPDLPAPRALATVCAIYLLQFLLPVQPLFWSDSYDSRNQNLWSHAANDQQEREARYARAKPLDVEAIYDRQQDVIAATVGALKTADGDRARFYFVGFAGYSGQDVFLREIRSIRGIVDERLGTAGRSMLLINHRDTVDAFALASASNLDRTLRQLGQRMDRERDFLLLYLTSHGSDGLFNVSFPGFRLNDLTPERLASVLDASGIKNRVIVVSACHSGSFLKALSNDNSIVMAAARADRSSFGCSNESEWTYFGDALFNHGLRQTIDLTVAFSRAQELVATWEKAQGLTPSEPQIHVGATMIEKLSALVVDLERDQIVTRDAVTSVPVR
jgi:Peptidase C13 family